MQSRTITFLVFLIFALIKSFAFPISSNVKIGEIPFIVSINSTYFLCCGTILSRNLVLTAADCVRGNEETLEVLAGSNVLGTFNQSSTVNNVIYIDPAAKLGALALLKLKTSFNFNRKVKPISLLPKNEITEAIKSGSEAYIAGWGIGKSRKLEKALIKILPKKDCIYKLPEALNFNKILDICFYPIEAGFSRNYFGGPLIVDNKLIAINIRKRYPYSTYFIYSKVNQDINKYITSITNETTESPKSTSESSSESNFESTSETSLIPTNSSDPTKSTITDSEHSVSTTESFVSTSKPFVTTSEPSFEISNEFTSEDPSKDSSEFITNSDLSSTLTTDTEGFTTEPFVTTLEPFLSTSKGFSEVSNKFTSEYASTDPSEFITSSELSSILTTDTERFTTEPFATTSGPFVSTSKAFLESSKYPSKYPSELTLSPNIPSTLITDLHEFTSEHPQENHSVFIINSKLSSTVSIDHHELIFESVLSTSQSNPFGNNSEKESSVITVLYQIFDLLKNVFDKIRQNLYLLTTNINP